MYTPIKAEKRQLLGWETKHLTQLFQLHAFCSYFSRTEGREEGIYTVHTDQGGQVVAARGAKAGRQVPNTHTTDGGD